MSLIFIRRLVIFSIIVCTFSTMTPAVHANSNSIFIDQPTQLTPIDVVVGLSRPPFVIERGDKGYEIELVTAILKTMEYQPKFMYVPLGRTLRMLDQGMGAMLLTINNNIVPNSTIRTNPYITYQNRAVYKSDTKVSVTKFADLRNLRVVAFQGATKYLGSEFASAVRYNKNYFEVPNQLQQVRLLLEGRIDVAVMEENIFLHVLELVKPKPSDEQAEITSEDFNFAPLFPPNNYSAAFKDPSLVPIFNSALDDFKGTEEFKKLKAKYNIKNQ
ncbi:transporter substrate-binding domain-containing protein [Psychrosphaera ytuae]|uniref:Transporter substrate-binding domain-containing protein n=1 Tax=Psychrosphaera ytuae TaxID=2820710 RepID=A0A975DB58_9GAMM|nr:transporter substrate-binding domain-containing protein [Psychrosphaera ytuae]QTH63709.1 transporter substrate-binding domain-containing protein [Psychrosphaera ytuae]